MSCQQQLVMVTVVCFLCFKIFDSLQLKQTVQFLDVQHPENIRLLYLKYAKMMNIAHTREKKY